MEWWRIVLVSILSGCVVIMVGVMVIGIIDNIKEDIAESKKKKENNEKQLQDRIDSLQEYITLQSRTMKGYALELNAYRKYVENKDAKPTITPIGKPTLRPAWQARIISQHGWNSNDWQEYQKQIEQITRWINDKCIENNAPKYIQYFDSLTENTRRELEGLGYVIVKDGDVVRICW